MNYPNYYPNYQQQYQQQYQQPQQSITIMPSEEEALKFPVAPGNSIMFKIENQPLIIEKTMGLSQLDAPVVKYIDLLERKPKEETIDYATKEDLDQLRQDIQALQEKLKKPVRKKEVEENE